jgi:hypothetical protein
MNKVTRIGTATQYNFDGLHIYGIHATQGTQILTHHEGFWDWDGRFHRAEPNAPQWTKAAEMAVIYSKGPRKPCEKKTSTP